MYCAFNTCKSCIITSNIWSDRLKKSVWGVNFDRQGWDVPAFLELELAVCWLVAFIFVTSTTALPPPPLFLSVRERESVWDITHTEIRQQHVRKPHTNINLKTVGVLGFVEFCCSWFATCQAPTWRTKTGIWKDLKERMQRFFQYEQPGKCVTGGPALSFLLP